MVLSPERLRDAGGHSDGGRLQAQHLRQQRQLAKRAAPEELTDNAHKSRVVRNGLGEGVARRSSAEGNDAAEVHPRGKCLGGGSSISSVAPRGSGELRRSCKQGFTNRGDEIGARI